MVQLLSSDRMPLNWTVRFWNCAAGPSKSGILDAAPGTRVVSWRMLRPLVARSSMPAASHGLADFVGVRLNRNGIGLDSDGSPTSPTWSMASTRKTSPTFRMMFFFSYVFEARDPAWTW